MYILYPIETEEEKTTRDIIIMKSLAIVVYRTHRRFIDGH
jgi:hypothetical protein